MLGEAHPGVDAHDKFSQMLWESFGDHLVQFVLFVATEKAQPAAAFLALANESRGIDADLPVTNSFPIAK